VSASVSVRSRPWWLVDVRVWVATALAFGFLLRLGAGEGASRLWILDPLLLGGFLVAVGRLRRNPASAPRFGRVEAVTLFLGMSWLSGMLYETTLSTGGGSTLGGMHPETLPSFALAQGFYVPYAVSGCLLARRTDVSLRTLFFAAGSVSVFEMLSTGTVVSTVASPLFALTPLLIVYYVSVYAMIICWPVAIFGLERFRIEVPRHLSAPRAIALMLGAGAVCWLLLGVWGLALEHFAGGFVAR